MTLEEAIIVKISHDLAGGIGAFMNTVDLIKIDTSFTQEGLDLLSSSGQMITSRLKFFRALFGAENKTINAELVKEYIATLASPIEIKGTVKNRLQLAMVAVGIEILPLGGVIEVQSNGVVLSGKELHHNPVFIQSLMGTHVPCSPENVTALWLAHLAEEKGKQIQLDTQESKLVLTIA